MIHTSSMRLTGPLSLIVSLAVFPSICAASAQPEQLGDPLPETIQKGDLVVGEVEVHRVAL